MKLKSGEILNLAGRALSGRGVGYLILFVTSRCNARCRMCFNSAAVGSPAREPELTVAEIERLAGEVPGLFQLVISGGEPFLREDLADAVLAFHRWSPFSIVSIPTNASFPGGIVAAADRLCYEMPDVNVRINVSIDGVGELHDEIRGVKGLYGLAVETARGLAALKKRRPNLSVNVQTVLTTLNMDRIDEIFSEVEEKIGPDFHGLGWPRGELCDPAAGDVDFSLYEKITRRLRETAGRRPPPAARAMAECVYETVIMSVRLGRWPMPCVAGRKMLVARENGDIFPCELLAHQIADPLKPAHRELETALMGNLREADFNLPGILSSTASGKMLPFIASGGCPCTFECGIYTSILFNSRCYPRILLKTIKAAFAPPSAGKR